MSFFGGPQKGRENPEDQRRMILAVVLSAGILFAWSYLFPTVPVETPQQLSETPASEAQKAAPSVDTQAAEPAAPQPVVIEPRELSALQLKDHVSIQLSNVDGQILSWQLEEAQYRLRDDAGKPADPQPLIVASHEAQTKAAFLPPLLELSLNEQLSHGEYAVAETAPDGRSAALRWRDPATGAEVTRRYTLSPENYSVDVSLSVKNTGTQPLKVGLSALMRGVQDDELASGSIFSPPIYLFESICQHAKDFERKPIKDIADPDEKVRFDEGVSWAGVENRYFMTAIFPIEGEATRCSFKAGAEAAKIDPKLIPERFSVLSTRVDLTGSDLAPGAEVQRTVRFYAGPKKLDVLRAQNPSAAAAIDFGFFSPISVPMLWLMRAFHGMFDNWGLAIIFLTLVVKLLTFPLTHKQYKSMAAMRVLQPKMAVLQKKYKEDKVRLQQEMMTLYREHKVNPMAGCFPMLLMMPIYFALYRTIYSAVELYQANFIFWIKDLSHQDPYFIFPLLLGGLMFVQTRLNPSATDAMQQKVMMYVMPIMFTAMMLFLPSGLVLYIFVNTLLGLAQQAYLLKREGRLATPAAA